MKRTILFALMLTLMVMVMPTVAQNQLTPDQQASVDVVSSALDGLKMLDTYTIHSEQTISTQMSMAAAGTGAGMSTEISQISDFQVQKTGDGYNAAGTFQHTLSMNMPGAAGNMAGAPGTAFTLKVVTIDGKTYIRFDLGDAASNPAASMMASMFPSGWVEAGAEGGSPLLASFGPEMLKGLYDLSLSVDTISVWSIEESAGEEMDGQAMRVFDISYNPETYFQSGALEALTNSIGSMGDGAGSMGGMPNVPGAPAMPDIPSPDAPPSLEDIAHSLQVSLRVYIGADDGLLHHMESTVTYDLSAMQASTATPGAVMPMVMSLTGATTFSNFNQPVTIEAPDLSA